MSDPQAEDTAAPLPTERLLLRPLDPPLARRIAAGTAGPGDRWGPGYPGPADRSGAARFLEVLAGHGNPWPYGAYEIERRADGLAIGGAGFHGPADAHGRVSIGYGLIPAVRGLGFAAEALRALLEHARSHGAAGADGDTDLANVASQRVMAAAGMTLVREDDRLRYYAATWARAAESS
ncbi:GNAT family N-acetyltransferase [Streptomyces sp. NBC_00503]|uniref:GNAT family N-acetyltransferase n=1 Tax=Streptomyces sp. NBC_00503 TaxID=2903659 RepID=UPI002E817D2D|nr:GNAT family N-acetyltransferase [Streptomyces sp. NBC_00503]WUD84487.1 GNAT family N-acetyltransferase [Streptomyces sp. NBC_00503]